MNGTDEKTKNYLGIHFEYNLHMSSIFLAKFHHLLLLVVRLKFTALVFILLIFLFPTIMEISFLNRNIWQLGRNHTDPKEGERRHQKMYPKPAPDSE